jgi:hypothetical protein
VRFDTMIKFFVVNKVLSDIKAIATRAHINPFLKYQQKQKSKINFGFYLRTRSNVGL